jgi:hypothetical protein
LFVNREEKGNNLKTLILALALCALAPTALLAAGAGVPAVAMRSSS